MFILKVNRKDGVSSAESAETIDGVVELARQNIDRQMSDEEWSKTRSELKSRRRWEDIESGVVMTIT